MLGGCPDSASSRARTGWTSTPSRSWRPERRPSWTTGSATTAACPPCPSPATGRRRPPLRPRPRPRSRPDGRRRTPASPTRVRCNSPTRSASVRPPSVLGSLGALVVLTAFLFTVVIAGVTGIVKYSTRVGALGDCARVGLCVRTPLATVEERTGVRLPDGVDLIRSSASRDGHFVGALVGLPAGVDAPQLPDGMSAPVTRRAASALRSASASGLEGTSAGPVGLFTGMANGRTILFLRYDADR